MSADNVVYGWLDSCGYERPLDSDTLRVLAEAMDYSVDGISSTNFDTDRLRRIADRLEEMEESS